MAWDYEPDSDRDNKCNDLIRMHRTFLALDVFAVLANAAAVAIQLKCGGWLLLLTPFQIIWLCFSVATANGEIDTLDRLKK